MKRDEIIMIFNSLITGERNQIIYSKDYKLFDEIYKLFSQMFNLKKEDIEGKCIRVTLESENEKCK